MNEAGEYKRVLFIMYFGTFQTRHEKYNIQTQAKTRSEKTIKEQAQYIKRSGV